MQILLNCTSHKLAAYLFCERDCEHVTAMNAVTKAADAGIPAVAIAVSVVVISCILAVTVIFLRCRQL